MSEQRDGDTSVAGADPNPLSRLVAARRVIICAGPGGVGKTTTAAAIAVHAAHSGRRACVMTIDPAKRLADAPQQVLQRQREGEHVAAPMIGVRKRGQEKAERRARPKRDERDQAAEAHHQRRRAPAR